MRFSFCAWCWTTFIRVKREIDRRLFVRFRMRLESIFSRLMAHDSGFQEVQIGLRVSPHWYLIDLGVLRRITVEEDTKIEGAANFMLYKEDHTMWETTRMCLILFFRLLHSCMLIHICSYILNSENCACAVRSFVLIRSARRRLYVHAK